LGDILFNGRSEVLSRTGFTLDIMSHRPLNRISPQTASRDSEKRQKHSKHTTGNGLQTLFRFLGFLHGKLPIFPREASAGEVYKFVAWGSREDC